MATYVNDLRLKEIGTGESSGTWGTETNTNLELIAEAFSFGTEAITTNADTHTTTIADGSTDPGRSLYLKYTGTLDSACTITIGPNTVSKLWFIENGTSGSQNIIISQGSGANITIPPGDTKAIYSDGAGSGAAMVDAFASLSVVDLKVQDDLTVTDDMTVGGTLGVTGIVTLTDDLIIGDGKTIGSASDVDAMTIASNGQITLTQTLIGTALDISGDIDVDGTTNLDVVDIDGALTQDGGAVFNEDSADVNFRVESNGDANMLFVDGGENRIGIGTGTPAKLVHIVGTADNGTLEGIQIDNTDHASGETGQAVAINLRLSRAGTMRDAGRITVGKDDDWDDNAATDSHMTFKTMLSNTLTEHMKITSTGQIQTTALGVSTPTYSFNNDTDTGMTRPTGDTLQFVCGGTVKNRISSDGLLFNSDTAAANALDDYEEGTFTPTFSSSNSTATGLYQKVGNTVTVFVHVVSTGGLPTSTSQVQIGNLPFTSASNHVSAGPLYIGPSNVSSAVGGGGQISTIMLSSETVIRLVVVDNTTLGYLVWGELEVTGNNVVTAFATHTYTV